MKKLSIIAIAAIVSAGGAWAEGATVSIGIEEIACFVPDAAYDSSMTPGQNFAAGHVHELTPRALGGTAVIQAVITPGGNFKYTCSGKLPPNATPSAKGATVYTGEDLGVTCDVADPALVDDGGGPFTLDWHAVVTKSGRVSISCHINGND